MKQIHEIIKNTNEHNADKVNWTEVWSKKYPVLADYSNKIDVEKYSIQLRKLLDNLKIEYQYNELDAMLILKDILYHEWKNNK